MRQQRRRWLFISMKRLAVLFVVSCIPSAAPPVYTPPDQHAIEAQQHDAFARSAGYPTQKTAADLQQLIDEQTRTYSPSGRRGTGELDTPLALTIDGVKGTCYKIVMRLAGDARWDRGADAGLRFDFTSPSGNGSGGPGVRGPGAVASVGCAEATGVITLTMAPLVGHDPIGHGRFDYEVFAKHLTAKEQAELEADKQRQIREQEEFAAQEQQKRHDRAVAGCSKCDGRYQGCIGAGRSTSTCQQQYSTCTFEEVGADAGSACPFPR
jgi:hypothetical protein